MGKGEGGDEDREGEGMSCRALSHHDLGATEGSLAEEGQDVIMMSRDSLWPL